MKAGWLINPIYRLLQPASTLMETVMTYGARERIAALRLPLTAANKAYYGKLITVEAPSF